MVRLNLVYYGAHTPEDVSTIRRVAPRYLIDNPPHGFWGQLRVFDNPQLLQDVRGYAALGIEVIGYTTGGYEENGSGSGIEKRWYTLDMNRKIIHDMAQLDGVKGVFIDECSAFPDHHSKKYLRSLTDLAHSLGLLTWGNTGTPDFDGWYFSEGGFDLMHSTERWRGQELSWTQHRWGHRISVTGCRRDYTAGEAARLTLDAWRKGIAYCYICHDGYTTLPPWLEQYGDKLKEQS